MIKQYQIELWVYRVRVGFGGGGVEGGWGGDDTDEVRQQSCVKSLLQVCKSALLSAVGIE